MVGGKKGDMMKSVSFHVPGKPQGKARARTFYNEKAEKHTSVTPEKTVLYENLIKTMYINAARGKKFEKGTPVVLRVIARFMPVSSASKKMQRQMLDGEIYPLKKPDMDNIIKVVADALNGVAYLDDTQIMMVNAKKVYSAIEGLDITVEEYANER